MRPRRTFIAAVLLIPFLLILFYSTFHLDSTYRKTAEFLKHLSLHSTPPHIWSAPVIRKLSVSSVFRHSFPQNGAYWNRLLHSALSSLDKDNDSLTHVSGWSHCRGPNHDHLQANIHDVASYPSLFQEFLHGMNCRSLPALFSQPSKCMSGPAGEDTFLLFAIKSTPNNFEQRQAVRESWGQEDVYLSRLRVRTVFLLGTSPPDDANLRPLLEVESKQYGDILRWDFHESFLNLTLKMKLMLWWTLTNCPHVSFVFSGDDDVFVNTPALLSYLVSLKAPEANRLYMGQVIARATPVQDPSSKYYIPLSFFDGPYPTYTGGGGFVLSGALLLPLYSLSHFIPLFPIDDVYIGMCCQALAVSPKVHKGFHTFDVREQDRQNLCIHKRLILIHKRSPRQLKKLWKGILSPLLTC